MGSSSAKELWDSDLDKLPSFWTILFSDCELDDRESLKQGWKMYMIILY